MGAFKFRLEPIVSLRKKTEDERKTALANAKRELKQKETHLINLCERRKACQNSMVAEPDGGNLNVPGKLVYYAYIERLTDEIASHACAVEQSREDVESKRTLLLESSREKKALEKLRERLKERFNFSARKAEQASMDETATQHHCRNGNGNLRWKKE
jgi:flagellar export protein FliJ